MTQGSWYYNKGLKPQGPISLQDLRLLIYKGEVGPYDLVSEVSLNEWKPAMAWACFEEQLFPAAQLQGEDQGAEWVLLVYSQGQMQVSKEGPYTVQQILALIQQGLVSPQNNYAWKPGLSGWCRLADRKEFLPEGY